LKAKILSEFRCIVNFEFLPSSGFASIRLVFLLSWPVRSHDIIDLSPSCCVVLRMHCVRNLRKVILLWTRCRKSLIDGPVLQLCQLCREKYPHNSLLRDQSSICEHTQRRGDKTKAFDRLTTRHAKFRSGTDQIG